MLDICLWQIRGQFTLASRHLPGWRCTGSTPADVMRDCAPSLRNYLHSGRSIEPYQKWLIIKALEVRPVKG